MICQKQEANGDLYQMSLYSAGIMSGSSPRQRAERRKLTDAAKAAINKKQRKWRLMQQLNANFVSGRDLFVCLTYRAPENEGRCLEKFHRAVKSRYEKLGIEYRYIAITESHKMNWPKGPSGGPLEGDMDGEPVRVHHHLILSGSYEHRLAGELRECWPYGVVDVHTLREGSNFFEDTAAYLLKEDKPRGARRYSTSRNLRPPAEPVRLRLPESECGEVPPGVAIVEHDIKANAFGRYEIMVGRIYDHRVFAAYWEKQRKRAAPDPWERLARRRRG